MATTKAFELGDLGINLQVDSSGNIQSLDISTTEIAEGTNLYHTTARARGAISVSGDLSYDSATGVISYTIPTTIASLSNHDTGDLAEGTNLYFTSARARASLTGSNDIVYTSSTGDIEHGSITRTDTTSTQTASHEGTVTVVDGITTSANGHVTAVNVKTVTLPAGAVPNNANITIDAGTDLVTGGAFTVDQSTDETITIDHANITRTDTTSADSPAHSGTFEAVTSVTTNARGHVTAIDVSTVTLPAGPNDGTITIAGGTDLETGGAFTTDQAAAETITIDHSNVTRTDTTSTDSPAHSGTFEAVTGVTTSATGHVTAIDVSTVTLPAGPNDGTITIAGGTDLETGGAFTTDQAAAETITLNHSAVTRSNTTSTASPAHSGTFTAVDSITTSSTGHITAVNTKTVTLPAGPNDATITISAGTDLTTGGNFTTDQGTNETITINHANITRTDTTSSTTATFGGTIDVVNSVTTNARGHVTAVDIETITLPTEADTLATVTGRGASTSEDITITGDLILGDGSTTGKQTHHKLYIGGDGYAGTDAAIYLGNRGDSTGYGWEFYYAGSGSGNNNELIIKSENLTSPVNALSFKQDGSATFDNNITMGGALYGPSTFYIDPSPVDTGEPGGATTDTGTVVILGDLQVTGETTTINSTVVTIDDKTLVLANNATTDAEANGAAVVFGGHTNPASIYYNSTNDRISVANVNGIEATTFYGALSGNATSATNADTVDGLHASQFLRSDANDTYSAILTVSGVVRSTNNANVDGPNFNVSTTNKTINEYAYRVDRSGTVVGGITIDGRGLLAAGSTMGGSRILTVADEGSGNGLDADTVDGQHLTDLDARYVNVTGDTMTGNLTISIPDGGSAPATTAILQLHGYEGRGAGIKIKDSVNSASGATDREWFVGTGYSQSGFNIGYSATGTQSSYSTQNKLTITTGGNVGIGTTAPDTPLHIKKTGQNETLLTLENYWSDINGLGNVGNYIDFKMTDDNATATPQVRIGMHVYDNDGGDAGIASEGAGNFVVYTMDPGSATDGTGTLSEKIRVTEKGNLGVGTSTPNAAVHIVSGTRNGLIVDHDTFGQGLILHRNDSSNAASIVFKNDAGQQGVLFATSADQLIYRKNSSATNNVIFHDTYHPNADKWTTARTLSLTGDVTGSVSMDGSGNVSMTTTVANDSHTHNRVSIYDNRAAGDVTPDGLPDKTAYFTFTDDLPNTGNTWDSVINMAGWGNGYRAWQLASNSGNGDGNTGLYFRSGKDTSWGTMERVFTTEYHPNADKWTTARTLSLTGDVTGSVSWDGSANVTLTAAVGNDSHTHSNYVLKAGDTMTGDLTIANSTPVLYLNDTDNGSGGGYTGYISFNNTGGESFRIGDWAAVNETNGPDILRIQNNNGTRIDVQFGSAGTTAGSLYVAGDKVFNDGYHPNADKWTTARTLTLTGDVTGSVSWDGSADVSMTTAVGNDSHNHSSSSGNFTVNGDLLVDQIRARTNQDLTITAGETYTILTDASYNDEVIRLGAENGVVVYSSTDNLTSGLNKSNTLIDTAGDMLLGGNLYPKTDNTGQVGNGTYTWNFGQFTNLQVDSTLTVRGAIDLADNDRIRVGSGDDMQIWHDGSNTYFRNYLHADGDFIWQGEGTGGVNHTVMQLKNDTTAPYVILYADSVEKFRTIAGGVKITGSVSQTETHYPDVSWGASTTSTGAILISLPGTSSQYDMVNIEITVYEYNSTAGSTITVSGHNWTTGWANSHVEVQGGYNKPIYLGRDGSKYYIQLGDTNSSWTYGSVHVTRATTATYYNVIDWTTGWGISQATTEPSYSQKSSNFNTASSATLRTPGTLTAAHVDLSNTLKIGSEVVLQESTDRADLLQITSTTSGWGGLQIRNSSNEGRWSFMTDGEASGIYNDEDGIWHIYMQENTARGCTAIGGSTIDTNYSLSMNSGGIRMYNNPIHYISEAHFQDGIRLKDNGNNTDLILRADSTSAVRLHMGTGDTSRGSIYATSSNEVGLLDSGGAWAIKHTNDNGTYFYTDGGTLEFEVGRDTVSGDYGTVQTSTTRGSWGGYSINGQYVFMSDHGSNVGIFNDIDNEWMTRWYRNGKTELHYNGSGKLETTSTGVAVTGLLTATQKSFTIDHPTKEGMKLRYGSLEGPENGVYVRGRLKGSNVIELPEVWTGLVHEDTITVELTAIGGKQSLWVVDFDNETVTVDSDADMINCFYTVYGERKDVEKLVTEFKEVE